MKEEESQARYEIMLIVNPELAQEETEKELNSVKEAINKDGKILDEDIWGLRDLATNIKTFDSGYYAIYYFSFNSEKIKELESNLNLNQKVLRHLISNLPVGYEVKKGMLDDEIVIKGRKTKEKPVQKVEPARPVDTKKTEEEAEEKKVEPKKEVKEEVKEEKAKPEPEPEPEVEVSKKEVKEEPKEEKVAEKEVKKDEPKEEKSDEKKTKKKVSDINVDKLLNEIMDDINL